MATKRAHSAPDQQDDPGATNAALAERLSLAVRDAIGAQLVRMKAEGAALLAAGWVPPEADRDAAKETDHAG